MTTEEANRIIAEYMGGPYQGDACIGHDSACIPMDYCKHDYECSYCKPIKTHYLSLDALVPVWEKLFPWDTDISIRHMGGEWNVDIEADPAIYTASDKVSIAAAIATAKAIKELK